MKTFEIDTAENLSRYERTRIEAETKEQALELFYSGVGEPMSMGEKSQGLEIIEIHEWDDGVTQVD